VREGAVAAWAPGGRVASGQRSLLAAAGRYWFLHPTRLQAAVCWRRPHSSWRAPGLGCRHGGCTGGSTPPPVRVCAATRSWQSAQQGRGEALTLQAQLVLRRQHAHIRPTAESRVNLGIGNRCEATVAGGGVNGQQVDGADGVCRVAARAGKQVARSKARVLLETTALVCMGAGTGLGCGEQPWVPPAGHARCRRSLMTPTPHFRLQERHEVGQVAADAVRIGRQLHLVGDATPAGTRRSRCGPGYVVCRLHAAPDRILDPTWSEIGKQASRDGVCLGCLGNGPGMAHPRRGPHLLV
jgi:hypothetical protein